MHDSLPHIYLSNRYTVLLLDVVLFLLKAVGEVDFFHAELNVLFWNFRGIHQIGLSQCESPTLEGCFGRCGSPHWRRWLLPISYHQVLIGTTESSYGYHHLALVTSWVRLGITELYWKSPSYTSCCYSGHGIGKELALRLADLGCLVVCVDRFFI